MVLFASTVTHRRHCRYFAGEIKRDRMNVINDLDASPRDLYERLGVPRRIVDELFRHTPRSV